MEPTAGFNGTAPGQGSQLLHIHSSTHISPFWCLTKNLNKLLIVNIWIVTEQSVQYNAYCLCSTAGSQELSYCHRHYNSLCAEKTLREQ